MALTGLDIFKQLPKTNCGDCGFPTCLAFAMQLAAKKVSLDKCPHVSEAGKAALDAAAAPPIRLVSMGVGNKFKVGQETVLFRHEESFYHPTGVAVSISDKLSEAEVKEKVEEIKKLSFDRVGQIMAVEFVAIKNDSGNPQKFAAAVKAAIEPAPVSLILISDSPDAISEALQIASAYNPVICAANENNFEKMAQLSKSASVPLVVRAKELSALADLSQKVTSLGVENFLLDPVISSAKDAISKLTQIRRLALKKQFRPFGFPVITFPNSDDSFLEPAQAALMVLKYAGIVVLDSSASWQIMPLLTARQNIYTDPRKPIMVEAKLYKIGEVDDKSPIAVTTNFSLTYFVVAGEVEASKVPTYILCVDTEGMSVLTSWAADKFNGEIIAKAVKTADIENIVSHKKLIIPGYVAVLSGDLQEKSGWDVMVGPREASGISTYLKTVWKAA